MIADLLSTTVATSSLAYTSGAILEIERNEFERLATATTRLHAEQLFTPSVT
jgi:hypothetical protein